MSGRLFTGRYQWFRDGAPEGLVVAGITVGSPKFPMKCEIDWSLRWAAPWGLMEVDDEDGFTDRYFERLDRLGVAAVRGRLLRLQEKHDGADLVLCCFEHLAESWCHRRVLAAWLKDRLSIEVPEWS